MNRINTVYYSLKQGIKGLWKNRMFTLASMGTVAACLFLFGLFYFVISNFWHMVQTTEQSVGFSIFFEEDISEEEIRFIGEQIQARQDVKSISYVSGEDAWEKFKTENFEDSQELIDSFGDENPLEDSSSYTVYLKDIDTQEDVVSYIRGLDGVRTIKQSSEVVNGLSSISKLVGAASVVLVLVLIFVSVFLIHSTIATGIAVRKQEIAIMRLIGASDFFIWSPFIVEGVIIGMVGSAVPLAVLSVCYEKIVNYITGRFTLFSGSFSFLSLGKEFAILVPASLAIGVGIGFLGSFITVRRNMDI